MPSAASQGKPTSAFQKQILGIAPSRQPACRQRRLQQHMYPSTWLPASFALPLHLLLWAPHFANTEAGGYQCRRQQSGGQAAAQLAAAAHDLRSRTFCYTRTRGASRSVTRRDQD